MLARRASRGARARAAAVPPRQRRPPAQRRQRGHDLAGVVAAGGVALGIAAFVTRPERSVAETGAGSSHESGAARRRATRSVHGCAGWRSGAAGAARARSSRRTSSSSTIRSWRGCAAELIAQGKSAGYAWRGAVRASVDALARSRRPAARRARRRPARPGSAGAGGARGRAGRHVDRASRAGHRARRRAAALAAHRARCEPHRGHLHGARRADLARRDPGRRAGQADAGESRRARARPSSRDTAVCSTPSAASCRSTRRTTEVAAVERDARSGAVGARPPNAPQALEPAVTADGVRIGVYANIGSAAEAAERGRARAPRAAACCAPSSCSSTGRSRRMPTTQAAEYQRVVDAFAGRPVVIRTLDAGGDKPIAYLPHAARGQPGARHARHAREPAAPGAAARAARGAAARPPAGRSAG